MAGRSHKTATAPDRPWARARSVVAQAPGPAALGLMALAGIAIAAYLTTVHYTHGTLLCPTGGIVNCTEVTTSSYSVVAGTQIPITIPGLLWFIVSGGLAAAAWRQQVRYGVAPGRLTVAQAGWGAIGLVTVLYLVYIEIVRLHAICEWCTGVHVLVVLSFLVALYRVQQIPLAT